MMCKILALAALVACANADGHTGATGPDSVACSTATKFATSFAAAAAKNPNATVAPAAATTFGPTTDAATTVAATTGAATDAATTIAATTVAATTARRAEHAAAFAAIETTCKDIIAAIETTCK